MPDDAGRANILGYQLVWSSTFTNAGENDAIQRMVLSFHRVDGHLELACKMAFAGEDGF